MKRLSKAVKFDGDKPRADLMSGPALLGLSRILGHGAEKYAADNWRKGMAWRRLIGAALRHLLDFADGQDLDEDSGLPTIDHVACCVMFLSEYQKRGLGADDRWRPPRTSLKRRKKRDSNRSSGRRSPREPSKVRRPSRRRHQ